MPTSFRRFSSLPKKKLRQSIGWPEIRLSGGPRNFITWMGEKMKNQTNLREERNVWFWVLGNFCLGWLVLWRLMMKKTRRACKCFESINNGGGLNLGRVRTSWFCFSG